MDPDVERRGLGPFSGPHRIASVSQLGAEFVVMHDPAQRPEQLRVDPIAESAAAEYARLVQGPAIPVDHHGGPDGEGLEDDVAERLGEQGRHHDRPRARLARVRPNVRLL